MSKKLAIRLAYHGCANRPFFHIVVMPKRKGRNSRVVEQLGTIDPLPNKHNEKLVAINFDRFKYYYAHGAELSKPVEKILGLSGFFPLHPMTYIDAQRNNKEKAEKLKVEEEKAMEKDTQIEAEVS